jgi:hypothetical protein
MIPDLFISVAFNQQIDYLAVEKINCVVQGRVALKVLGVNIVARVDQ